MWDACKRLGLGPVGDMSIGELMAAVVERVEARTRPGPGLKRWHWYEDNTEAVICVVGDGADVTTWPVIVRMGVCCFGRAQSICDAHNATLEGSHAA